MFVRTESIKSQSGVALVVALVLLTGVTVIALAALDTSMLTAHLAANSEQQIRLRHRAQAGLSALRKMIDNNPNELMLKLPADTDSCCTAGFRFSGVVCTDESLSLASTTEFPGAQVYVERIATIESLPSVDASIIQPGSGNASASLLAISVVDTVNEGGGYFKMMQGYRVSLPPIADVE